MRRSCDRPSCAAVATTWFVFDGRARRVQLRPIDAAAGSPAGSMGLLCERHAARFTPPRGWSVELVEPVRVAPVRPAQAQVRPHAEVGAVATVATADDFDRLLEAESPLLARAFRTAIDGRS